MRDINELIHQREAESARLHRELERIAAELEALRLAAKLLNENIAEPARAMAAAAPAPKDNGTYAPAPTPRPAAAPAATPTAWASAKQFP
ncbi:MAG: hypothetical protein JOZ10_02445 [Acidobacteria bacterium]|nr:hypothetical protein [Acidobacteriota bacterium]MBV9147878.1 hypothetical protein [Acidobacteriota bacterium]